jgi:hypothetical protein
MNRIKSVSIGDTADVIGVSPRVYWSFVLLVSVFTANDYQLNRLAYRGSEGLCPSWSQYKTTVKPVKRWPPPKRTVNS